MAGIRAPFPFQFVAPVLLIMSGIPMLSEAQPSEKASPRDLAEYVHEARLRGMKESKIRQDALAVGWSAAAIDEAIAFEKTDRKSSAAAPAETVADGASKAVPSPSLPAVVPTKPAAGANTASTNRGVPDDYQIGAGDTLQVSVWKEPDASVPNMVVRPDGKITVPMMKEVEVAGLTPTQAENVITEGLKKFLTEPMVTVVVTAINSKKIYVIGAVKNEGPLAYTYGMTVMQALSESGGLTDYAKRKKIYILRTENGREYRLNFNYDEVVKGERMQQNVVLLPSDTLVVPH